MTLESLIYEEANHSVDVRLDGARETVWLRQRQMAEVFDTTSESVVMHFKEHIRGQRVGRTSNY